jgi:hypothetical protein
MSQNPYKSSREAIARRRCNWRWLCISGMWLAGGTFSAMCLIQAIGLTIVKIIHPGNREMETSAGQILLIVMIPIMFIIPVGLLMAVVGGIGWAVKAAIRR